MVVLLGIAFVAGVITAVSPCVLPVLPIVLAGGVAGSRRRPFAVIAGLVGSFAVFTVFGLWVLDRLGLPKDLLRNIGIGLLFLVAAMLIVPQVGLLVERPLARLGRRPSSDLGGGFLLGLALGPVFVPCAGPVLSAVALNANRFHFGWRTILVTIAYSIGAALPMLAIAVAGREAIERAAWTKRQLARLRPALGVVIAGAAVVIALGLDIRLARHVPSYTQSAQSAIEDTATARQQLEDLLGGTHGIGSTARRASGLTDYGQAPDFQSIDHWLNTPGDRPLSLAGLRGKVVLVDFWTYSCINCLRTLPYLESWYRTYAKDGFVIVGVHTPEFAFEHVLSNVRAATHQLGVRYPVALDNNYATWDAYGNQYWPAEYLIDRGGHVREVHFAEGQYAETEQNIRSLLAERVTRLPKATDMPDRTPTGLITPETYLGYERLDLVRYRGQRVKQDDAMLYLPPAKLGQNEYAYGGVARVEGQRLDAIRDTSIRLHFHARDVYIVLGGNGTVRTLVDGGPYGRFRVTQDRLYTAVSYPRIQDRLLELRLSPGVQAYSFTFG
jgi:cytochrome c biogenesis protein CcdA/thiol-disulfide isomerase/thioredoxin